MSKLPSIHLCIQQPAGYVHSLGLLDPARYFRYQFRRLGAEVTIAKNRLRHDAVNFVFGAHLGFEGSLRDRFACIFVNLEQLGAGGAQVSPEYLQLLAGSAVVDYDADNRAAYAKEIADVPVVPVLHAPYLRPIDAVALEERPIDLLFIGSMNARRRAWLDRIEALGLNVSMFDRPLYGAERDRFIGQAKAVVNAHFYETSRFEQIRVSHCLSLGTPVISERTPGTRPHAAFEDCVLWLEGEGQLEQFFGEDFSTPAFFELARTALAAFERADPVEAYADLLAFATGFTDTYHARRPPAPWRPNLLNLGVARGYRPGWLNVDASDRVGADLVLDLSAPLALPLATSTDATGPLLLAEGAIDAIDARDLPAVVRDLPTFMGQCLQLLRDGGELHIDLPAASSTAGGPAPGHVRSLDPESWRAFIDGFSELGWVDHRFEMGRLAHLDAHGKECVRHAAVRMNVILLKTETTPLQRMLAQTMQPTLDLPADAIEARQRYRSAEIVPAPPALAAPAATVPAWAATPALDALAMLRRARVAAPVAPARPLARAETAAAAPITTAPPANSNYYDGLNLKLLAAIPAGARRVLELGCANGRLGRRFKELHPGVQWWGVDLSAEACATAAPHLDRVVTLDLDRADLTVLEGGFDVVVIGDLLEHLRQPAALLAALCDLTTDDAKIVCCLPNMGHLSVIERLVAGDISYDSAGLLDQTHVRFFSPSSAFKTFLDGGWLPHMPDQYRVDVPQTHFAARIVDAAIALGVPAETALRNMGLYQMILVCPKRARAPMDGAAEVPFSVIVAVNRPWQYELNVGRSPGLREIGADIVCVQGADSAAAAHATGAARALHPWRLFVHQDVYFPVGSGHAIARHLAALQARGVTGVPVGFAGLDATAGEDGTPRHAGLVVDRTHLFSHPTSDRAVSIDEFAVALHRDAALELDPALGWHLWATDLCIQAEARLGRPAGRVVDVPLFHNSASGYVLPAAFHESARLLLDKYPGRPRIASLCATFERPVPAIATATGMLQT